MALSELQLLFRRCLHRRIGANEFRELLQQFRSTRGTKSRDVVSVYLNCCFHFCVEGDPLLRGYLQAIVLSESALLFDFVAALLLQWRNVKVSNEQAFLHRLISTHSRVVTDLNIILATSGHLDSPTLRKSITISARWLAALAKWALSDEWKENNASVSNLTEAVGFLLVSLLNLNMGDATQSTDLYNAIQQALDQCMGAFPTISMELMNKLSTLPKPATAVEQSADSVEPHVMGMAQFQFESGINDPPIVATRSATTALLYQALRCGSTIDDSVVYAFLNTRHVGNSVAMFNDIVTATIDTMTRPDSTEVYQTQCQVFLLNKLPSILAYIVASSYDAFSSEQCLLEGWNYLNTTTNSDIIATGKRFLQICSFHHLIPTESVTGLIGEDGSTSLKGLYAKDDLVGQVNANHTRGPRLVEELLKNDGNAGSISHAIYEIITNYCHLRETQHLKEMANAIVRKPAALSSISLFVRPSNLLPSLCTLLDEWKWDDIHGESQPVYDEFGSVFLLIVAFKQRLGLTDSELGIQRKDGFLARYFSCKNTEERKRSESTEKHLGDWIKSLYVDEGLSDELTTSCSAQEFYMLVPTLLRQSVTAHSRGKLSNDALKAGLEYLLEPFLLPSLLPAFGWIAHIAEVEPKAALLVLQILNKSPGSVEGRELHQTILSIAADALRTRKLKGQLETTVNSMQKSHFGMVKDELSTWTAAEAGVLATLTRNVATPEYSPGLLTAAIEVHGPLQVAHTFVSLLLQFSGSHEFHSLLDFIATIGADTLRSAVQVIHGKVGHYLKKGENLYAEAVVHLFRRIELYANALTPQEMGIGQTYVPIANATNIILDDLPETFQQQPEQQNADIDQVLNEAAVMDSFGQIDNSNLEDMYQENDFGLNLDDLDLDMF